MYHDDGRHNWSGGFVPQPTTSTGTTVFPQWRLHPQPMPHQGTCPGCGRCLHCGQPAPYPYWPAMPWITWSSTTYTT